jgi:hypothetical protein
MFGLLEFSLQDFKKVFLTCLLVLSLSFSSVSAQNAIEYKLASGESGLGGNTGNSTDCRAGYFCIKQGSVGNFIQNTFNLAIGISIAVAVLLLIFKGTALLLAEYSIGDLGKNSVARAQHKSDMLDPIIGLIIVFCSVVVVRTLNPDLLVFPFFDKLNFETTQGGNTSGGTGSTGGGSNIILEPGQSSGPVPTSNDGLPLYAPGA